MKPVSILECIARRQGCAVFRLDKDGVVAEVAGMKVLEPESVLGLKVTEQIPYPTDARIFQNLIKKIKRTGSTGRMIVPVFHENEVRVLYVQIKKAGPAHGLLITAVEITDPPQAAVTI